MLFRTYLDLLPLNLVYFVLENGNFVLENGNYILENNIFLAVGTMFQLSVTFVCNVNPY